ncbi:MAG TPA: SDR family oxidoreductase [Acidimicrobiales bacterium]|jgi:NAD(P)-dependent dehydrogenase (short-subunit alcohol dehydrogenase family)|nr:SDR family oxidoreductase [Acidimicrobiales bacterium]
MAAIAVVTGANSGIGRATAIHLAAQGYETYGTVRDRARATKLAALSDERGVEVRLVGLDVADDESVRRGFDEILAATGGRVDVLVNNAGVAGNGTVEDTDPAAYLEAMNINLCGAVRCCQAVLPGMRERGSGAIVNVSSVAGRVAALAQSSYVTSKWALEALSEGLAQEVAPFGIRVAIVEPGVTRSAIFAKSVDVPDRTGAYGDHYRRMFQMYAAGLAHATDPFDVAEVIHHAVTTESPQLRYRVSWGSEQLIGGRERMTDAEWLSLGAAPDDDAYYSRFQELFGLDIRPDG